MKTESKKFPAMPVASWEKEQAKHTPTPWKFSFEQIDPEWAVITAQGGFCVANVISEPNAEFICRAVNSHTDLLEACKAVLACDNYASSGPIAKEFSQVLRIVEAAIQKAEGAL